LLPCTNRPFSEQKSKYLSICGGYFQAVVISQRTVPVDVVDEEQRIDDFRIIEHTHTLRLGEQPVVKIPEQTHAILRVAAVPYQPIHMVGDGQIDGYHFGVDKSVNDGDKLLDDFVVVNHIKSRRKKIVKGVGGKPLCMEIHIADVPQMLDCQKLVVCLFAFSLDIFQALNDIRVMPVQIFCFFFHLFIKFIIVLW